MSDVGVACPDCLLVMRAHMGEMCWAHTLNEENKKLSEEIAGLNRDRSNLIESIKNLRNAQRSYMSDRGNDIKGKEVALAASKVDELLSKLSAKEILPSLPRKDP